MVTLLTRWLKWSSKWLDPVWNTDMTSLFKKWFGSVRVEASFFRSFKWYEINPKLRDEIWMPERQIIWLASPNPLDNQPAWPVPQELPLWVGRERLTVSDEKCTKSEVEVVNNKSLWKTIWRKREKSNSIFQFPAEMSILNVFEFCDIRKSF